MKGLVIKSTGSWYEVQGENGSIYQSRLRGKFKHKDLKLTNPIAVGDFVDYEIEENQESAIIKDILPRKNYIVRKSSRKKHYSHIIAANIDKAILFVTLKSPRTSTGFINRFLISAESFRIPVVIVFNKIDLYRPQEEAKLDVLIPLYESLGYKCLKTSVLEYVGIKELNDEMKESTCLVAGHSGVGKSSLLNLIDDNLELDIAGLTKFTDKGSHTTTFAQMYPLLGGYIIDTPGIKEFGLEDMTKSEISHYFPEMRAMLGECKYHNCLHINEPQCAVYDAFERGEIHSTRYKTYMTLMNELSS